MHRFLCEHKFSFILDTNPGWYPGSCAKCTFNIKRNSLSLIVIKELVDKHSHPTLFRWWRGQMTSPEFQRKSMSRSRPEPGLLPPRSLLLCLYLAVPFVVFHCNFILMGDPFWDTLGSHHWASTSIDKECDQKDYSICWRKPSACINIAISMSQIVLQGLWEYYRHTPGSSCLA